MGHSIFTPQSLKKIVFQHFLLKPAPVSRFLTNCLIDRVKLGHSKFLIQQLVCYGHLGYSFNQSGQCGVYDLAVIKHHLR